MVRIENPLEIEFSNNFVIGLPGRFEANPARGGVLLDARRGSNLSSARVEEEASRRCRTFNSSLWARMSL